MAAAYDTYDYPSYWKGRDYEHDSEVIALKDLLSQIPKVETILEIGAGFARLAPSYMYRARKIILTDPSAKLLGLARETLLPKKKIKFIQAGIERLPEKIKPNSVDLIIMIRVLHHIEKPEEAFSIIKRMLKPNGYLILEFANKGHLKATLREFGRGNLTFPLDIFPKDIRSAKSKKNNTLPFINFHPDVVKHQLSEIGFKILEARSVSNIRSVFLKKIFSLESLLGIEKLLQKPLSYLSLGPSIFILAQKKG